MRREGVAGIYDLVRLWAVKFGSAYARNLKRNTTGLPIHFVLMRSSSRQNAKQMFRFDTFFLHSAAASTLCSFGRHIAKASHYRMDNKVAFGA